MPWGRATERFKKELKCPKNWLRRLQNFARRDMMCSRASGKVTWFHEDQREKSIVFCVFRGITGRLIYWKDLFSSVFAFFAGSSAGWIYTEVNCQIVVSDFVTWRRLCFPYKLSSCFSDISLYVNVITSIEGLKCPWFSDLKPCCEKFDKFQRPELLNMNTHNSQFWIF